MGFASDCIQREAVPPEIQWVPRLPLDLPSFPFGLNDLRGHLQFKLHTVHTQGLLNGQHPRLVLETAPSLGSLKKTRVLGISSKADSYHAPIPAKPASISGVPSPPRALLKFHFYSTFPWPAPCTWKINNNMSLEVCRPLRGQELPLATGPP